MESESDTTAADTSVVLKSGRPTRRNKITHQTERDKNQENIDDSLKDAKGLAEPVMEMEEVRTVAKVDDKQASSTPNTVNSSTPRRRKDPLANLHSNLSPKYIGFVTPTSNLDNSNEERTRKTRRRQNLNNSADTSLTKDTTDQGDEMAGQLFGTRDTSVGYVRRIPKESNDTPDHKNGRRKEFVSPIDKLLKKNGSIVDNDMLPEEDCNMNKDIFPTEDCSMDKGKLSTTDYSIDKFCTEDCNMDKEKNSPEYCEYDEDLINDMHYVGDVTEDDEEVVNDMHGAGDVTDNEEEEETEEQNNNKLQKKGKEEEDMEMEEVLTEAAVAIEIHNDISETTSENSYSPDYEDNTETMLKQDTDNKRQFPETSTENGYSSDSEDIVKATDKRDITNPESTRDNDYTPNFEENSGKIDPNTDKPDKDPARDNEWCPEMKADDAYEKPAQFKLPAELSPPKEVHMEKYDNIESQTSPKPSDSGTEIPENVDQKCEIKIDLDTADTESNAEFVVDAASAKSPSAISMDSAKGSSILNEGSWMSFSTGDLFWGQIYNYCYWPCMVCPDPEGKSITTKENNLSGDQHVMVHVRFFADNARRNWVKRDNLMPFTTLEQYQERLEECREKHGAKSTKFKSFVPKKKKVPVWYEAIAEANIVADVPYEERLEKFYEIFEKCKSFQIKEKQRRKSMYLPTARLMSASDAESLYGSHENVNNLSAPTAGLKRERSTSPFSPAYSPIKNMTGKKRKLSEDLAEFPTTSAAAASIGANTAAEASSNNEQQQTYTTDSSSSQNSSANKSLRELDIFNGMEFQKLYSAMKDFVLEGNTDDKLDKSLVVAVRNIWALKQLSRQQMRRKLSESMTEIDFGANDGESATVKRLSNRLRNIMVRKTTFLTQRSSFDSNSEMSLSSKHAKEMLSTDTVEKPKKPLNRPILEVIDDIFDLDKKYLFKGMACDPVCKYCCRPGGNLRRCAKHCHYWLHAECLHKNFSLNGTLKRAHKRPLVTVKSTNDSNIENNRNSTSTTDLSIDATELSAAPHVTSETETEVICKECANNEPTKCMVCNLTDSGKLEDPLVKCCMGQCDRAFHPACCKYWPQSKITISKNHIQSFRCPSHVCHTCVSDDPKGKFQHLSNGKITKCIRCPATFHMDSTCIPAGSQILTAAHIICPRHASLKHDMTVNVNWCFICVGGGQLVCCETCPTAVHAQCLKIPIDPNEGYICEECESGRMPLYGEMVWAKFNTFRWWPAIILPPTEIPQNIARKTHNPSDFVVRFFGTHDHGWISRRRVYLYLEGDSSEPPKTKSPLDLSYNRGVEEAKEVHEIVKAKKLLQRTLNENKEKLLHPQPYARIKVNRAVPPVKLQVNIESVSKCDCDPRDKNPCGPETNCLNRVLYHECSPKVCPARERCQNQMFESRVSPRLDVIYMKERGFGLISRETIAAGSFVIEYVGEVIDDDEFRARMAQKSLDRDENFYFLSVEKDYIIDAGPKGNLARFMNHSCDPNCETQKWSVNSLTRVGLFAIKDIPENTELTFNYHWDDLLGNEKKTCFCGSKRCSGQIGGKIRESESKEPSPSSDNITAKPKGKTKTKAKLKPLKRLHSKTTLGKRKSISKLKVNAAKYKTNKMAAAAAVAAAIALEFPETNTNQDDGTDKEASSTGSQPPEDVLC